MLGRVVSTAWAFMCHQAVPASLGTSRQLAVATLCPAVPLAVTQLLGCQDQLDLTGCHARLAEALRKDLWLEFCWEAQESEDLQNEAARESRQGWERALGAGPAAHGGGLGAGIWVQPGSGAPVPAPVLLFWPQEQWI